MISDDLSHWSDIFTWRQHHYQFIIKHYDNQAAQSPTGEQVVRTPTNATSHQIFLLVLSYCSTKYVRSFKMLPVANAVIPPVLIIGFV